MKKAYLTIIWIITAICIIGGTFYHVGGFITFFDKNYSGKKISANVVSDSQQLEISGKKVAIDVDGRVMELTLQRGNDWSAAYDSEDYLKPQIKISRTDDGNEKITVTQPDAESKEVNYKRNDKANFIKLQETIEKQSEAINEMKPKALVGECLQVSKDAVLVRELAKILKQNGIDIGQNRLFEWLRENGYLIKTGSDKNMPTQRAMNLKLFEVKHTNMICNGETKIRKTTMVTGKGINYFINKFISLEVI